MKKITLIQMIICSLLTLQLFSQASIEVTVFFDPDQDGFSDPTDNECTVSFVDSEYFDFELRNDITGYVESLIDLNTGVFVLGNIPAGDDYYIVAMSTLTPTVFNQDQSLENAGDTEWDSDFQSLGELRTENFSLSDGETKTNIDLGVKQLVAIGGRVWIEFGPGSIYYDWEDDYYDGENLNLIAYLYADLDGDDDFTDEIAVSGVEENGQFIFQQLDAGYYLIKIPLGENNYIGNQSNLYSVLPGIADRDLEIYKNMQLEEAGYPNNAVYDEENNEIIIPVSYYSLACDIRPIEENFLIVGVGLYENLNCEEPNYDYFVNESVLLDWNYDNPTWNLPMCNLNNYENECYTLFPIPHGSNISNCNPFTSNVAYSSFIAGEGEYTIDIQSFFCEETDGSGLNLAIYSDVDFTNEVICLDECESNISLSNKGDNYELMPGDVYFLVLSSCYNSVCNFSVDISDGYEYVAANPPTEITLYNTNTNEYITGDITTSDTILIGINPDNFFQDNFFYINNEDFFIDTYTELEYVFYESGTYEICFGGPGKCTVINDYICRTVNVEIDSTGILTLCSYNDGNNNQNLDENDFFLNNVHYETANGIFLNGNNACTDVVLRYGDHDITAEVPYANWMQNPITKNITYDGNQDTLLFAFNQIPSPDSLQINISHQPFRCDRLIKIYPSIKNLSYSAFNGQLEVTLDPQMTYVGSSIEPLTVNGQVITFEVNDLQTGNSFNPIIRTYVPGVEAINDELNIKAIATSDEGDYQVQKIKTDIVSCGYDPNDKLVYPYRDKETNPTLVDELIYYTIRFQNTGNAPAYDVYLQDILSDHLDRSTLMVLDASHDVRTVIKKDTLLFFFDDINLIDSISDPIESQGFVSFSIAQNKDLDIGTIINNTANIYFDANPPIITNTVINTIVEYLPCIDPVIIRLEDQHLCPGLTYTVGDSIINTAGVHAVHMGYSKYGCDSLHTVNIEYYEHLEENLGTIFLCDNETYEFEGTAYSEPGDYNLMLSSVHGCDSLVTFSLQSHESTIGNLGTINICEGESYTIGDHEYNVTGTYQLNTGHNVNGCDSITKFSIIVYDTVENDLGPFDICDQEELEIGGYTYTEEGNYELLLSSETGCDSMLFFTVISHESYTFDEYLAICPGDTLMLDTLIIEEAGTYSHHYLTENGCDSILTYHVTMLDADDPTCKTSAINDVKKTKIKIYPNPFKELLRLIPTNGDIKSYHIYNIQGELWHKGSNPIIETHHFPAGMYLLHIEDDSGNRSIHKVIKY